MIFFVLEKPHKNKDQITTRSREYGRLLLIINSRRTLKTYKVKIRYRLQPGFRSTETTISRETNSHRGSKNNQLVNYQVKSLRAIGLINGQ